MLKIIILLFSLSLILSCESERKVSTEEINSFIEKHDTTSFLELKGVFIHLRQATKVQSRFSRLLNSFHSFETSYPYFRYLCDK